MIFFLCVCFFSSFNVISFFPLIFVRTEVDVFFAPGLIHSICAWNLFLIKMQSHFVPLSLMQINSGRPWLWTVFVLFFLPIHSLSLRKLISSSFCRVAEITICDNALFLGGEGRDDNMHLRKKSRLLLHSLSHTCDLLWQWWSVSLITEWHNQSRLCVTRSLLVIGRGRPIFQRWG